MSTVQLHCVIIEDQGPAQRILQRYVDQVPFLRLCGTFGDGISSLDVLRKQRIDLLFLDINLPKISGLDFLRTLQHPPKVILTTAYPEYALEGFELAVLDYLLKPFSFDRFFSAVSRALPDREVSGAPPQEIQETDDFIFVKVDKNLMRIDFTDILFIKAEGDFVSLYTVRERYLLSQTLKYWKAVLPARDFMQVHRSYMLRVEAIQRIQGNTIYTARGELPVSRQFRDQLLARINLK